ncbi:5984_t:CDS:2, partial [Racocetra persica]
YPAPGSTKAEENKESEVKLFKPYSHEFQRCLAFGSTGWLDKLREAK